jgi:phospholipase C
MDFVRLSVGHFGDDVVRLHESLKSQGFVVSEAEAKRKFFGPATRAVVLEFQKRQRLEVNGTIDQQTALALSTARPTLPKAPQAAPAVPSAQRLNVQGRVGGQTAGVFAGEDSSAGATVGPPSTTDESATSNFARETEVLPITVGANASTEVLFGPPTAGYILVSLDDMWTGPVSHARMARRAGYMTTTAGGAATEAVATPRDQTGGGGGGNDGAGQLPPRFFRVELIPPFVGAAPVLDDKAPFEFTIPPPVHARIQATVMNLGDAPKWKLRVTNTFEREATGHLLVTYLGTRPVLRKEIDLEALNHLLGRVIAGSRPITVALENRTTQFGQTFLTRTTTFLIVLPDQDMQRQFGVHAFDLGVKIIDKPDGQQVTSFPMKVSLTVNDGRLALKSRIDFPFGTKLLIKDLVTPLIRNALNQAILSLVDPLGLLGFTGSALDIIGDAVSSIEDVIIGRFEDSEISDNVTTRTLGADVSFTLRDLSLNSVDAPGNTCDIKIRPQIELEGTDSRLSVLVSSLIEGVLSHAYDFSNPAYDTLAGLRNTAELIWSSLGHYLLGRDRPELVYQSVPRIGIRYAGDKPQPTMATTGDSAGADTPLPDPGLLANIDHIVVLMMENRSFDQMLGHLSLPAALGGRGRHDVDGLRGTEFGIDRDGTRAYVFPFTHSPATLFGFDPGHDFSDQQVQRGGQTLVLPSPTHGNPNKPPFNSDDIGDDAPNEVTVPPMGGFVLAYRSHIASKYVQGELSDASRNYGRSVTDIMGYHLPSSVPVYSSLADHALICDRWFAAHPGDTWPNRFITLTGSLAPKPPHDPHAGFPEIETPDPQNFIPVHVRNIFDHLTTANVTWRYYEHDMCMLRLFADYTLGHPNIVQIDDPIQGLQAAVKNPGTFPSVVFIDPDLTDIPAGNDDHPPTDIAGGQRLVKKVYDLLSSKKELWDKTMLIVTYDEYGGFYDHVLPPVVSDPADPNYISPMFSDPEFPEQAPLGQFHPVPVHYRGPRVPAFIVSPWVEPGTVSHLVFDHTSILKTIITRFLHDNPPRMGERVDRANGLENVLSARLIRVTGTGSGSVLAKPTPRAPAILAAAPAVMQVAAPAIAPGGFVDDFRTLMSAVRDRNRLH